MSDLYTDEYMKAVSTFKAAVKEQDDAYQKFKLLVFDGKVFDKKIQELMALSAACAIQCQYCIEAHSKKAKSYGATAQEISTTIQIAAVIKAGATQTYGMKALEE